MRKRGSRGLEIIPQWWEEVVKVGMTTQPDSRSLLRESVGVGCSVDCRLRWLEGGAFLGKHIGELPQPPALLSVGVGCSSTSFPGTVVWREGLKGRREARLRGKVKKGTEGPVGQISAHRPGGVEREVRAVVPRWCSARSSAPLAGGGAGLCGCCQGLRLRARGRPSPGRGGASVGLARVGGPTGRIGSGE